MRMRGTTRPTFCCALSSIHPKAKKKYSVDTSKRWNTHGAIVKEDRNRYFYIPLKESVQQLLVPKVEEGNYVLLFGPRAASKSTHLEEAKDLLNDKYCILS